jgi:hypothetical protein
LAGDTVVFKANTQNISDGAAALSLTGRVAAQAPAPGTLVGVIAVWSVPVGNMGVIDKA